jgi:hypothetical protein
MTIGVGSFHSTGRVDGRFPISVTSVDNLVDFTPAVKNQVLSVTIRSILLRPSKIRYP